MSINKISILSLSIALSLNLSGCITLTKKNEITYIESNFMRINKNYVEKKMIVSINDEILNFQKIDKDYIEKDKKVRKIPPKIKSKEPVIKKKVKEEEIIDKTTVELTSKANESELVKYFFMTARNEVENMRKELSKTLPNILRAGFFDLSQPGQKNKYNDSNYFAKESFLTTTYRPKTLYGNDFTNYIAYCPIFFNWDNKNEIAAYFTQFNLTPESVQNKQGVSFDNLAKYVVGVSYAHCLSFNEAYKGRGRSLSIKESIEVADMFLIGLFAQNENISMIDFIISNNELLHKENYTPNKQKLINYYSYINKDININSSDYYKLWKLSYNYSLKNK